MAAAVGHDALGVDLSEQAIELARAKAIDRGIQARFTVADALRLGDLGERFDTVLDCGLFHVLDDAERVRYVLSLAEVLPQGAHVHILCFSDRQPGDWGPRRVSQGEIAAALGEGWTIESIEPAVIELTWDSEGALAWHVSATRM
jgi:SAM-dependent methyltransferase